MGSQPSLEGGMYFDAPAAADSMYYLTEHFTILKPESPSIDKLYVVKKRGSTDIVILAYWNA